MLNPSSDLFVGGSRNVAIHQGYPCDRCLPQVFVFDRLGKVTARIGVLLLVVKRDSPQQLCVRGDDDRGEGS